MLRPWLAFIEGDNEPGLGRGATRLICAGSTPRPLCGGWPGRAMWNIVAHGVAG